MTLTNKLAPGSIGVFDSGYGGLTILSEIQSLMPEYDYIYLGDNLRAPYGSRSFETVYEFTKQAVEALFGMGCNLVVLACNTASAKALRTIQQNDLPMLNPDKRVLGVIRPTVEVVGNISKNGHIGILGTIGTIQSKSYDIEIAKFYPDFKVSGQACPMWAPLVENNEYENEGADYFVRKNIGQLLTKDADIDTIILGCTHYPILLNSIKKQLPENINVISQGYYVANSLKDYLHRHTDMDSVCKKNGITRYYSTESPEKFEEAASIFMGKKVSAERLIIQ
ncbi:glutamate racemase [Dysgonomonas sp. 216]|uniref:glutamate racemase n=1 Tax=Dysgonomonas sp. 216 TaxID=2302934 RepID=UPI0013D71AC0|nr:glutamate racemase [Dysgonomonas sp. 216]NDW19031.1 glutamate racemase [Dysgonomonas sp. 216]